jgi:hypothetical protein
LCNFFNACDDLYCGGCGWDLRTLDGTSARAPAAPAVPNLHETIREPEGLPQEELETLFGQTPPPAQAVVDAPSSISQDDIDSFFRKLSEKGDAELRRPAAGPDPAPAASE